MPEGVREYRPSLIGEFPILKTYHQLVVNLQTPLIEVRRAHIHDVVNDDEFRVEDLGLILKNLDAGFEESAIQTLTGQLRNEDV